MPTQKNARPAAVYVPLLPDALVDFCGAPLPFVRDAKSLGEQILVQLREMREKPNSKSEQM